MTAWRLGILVLGLTTAVGCALTAGKSVPARPSALSIYRVAPPDQLEISIRPEPAITRVVTVRPDGRVSLDLIGDLEVASKTVEEIRDEITTRIARYIVHPDVTVILRQSSSRTYYVFGQVRAPGAYPIIGTVTVAGALGQARGGTKFAALNSARLVRPTEAGRVFRIRLEDITQRGIGDTNYELQPGDMIYVPPTLGARVGFAIQAFFFPVQQALGVPGKVIGTALLP
ncbi:MAG: polysaccharide biosynthesis/export family protein [Myxococcota bacterium]